MAGLVAVDLASSVGSACVLRLVAVRVHEYVDSSFTKGSSVHLIPSRWHDHLWRWDGAKSTSMLSRNLPLYCFLFDIQDPHLCILECVIYISLFLITSTTNANLIQSKRCISSGHRLQGTLASSRGYISSVS